MKTKTEVVAQMKAEILEDIDAGRVPADVKSFGELHDHVDANCYGGFCEDEVADAMIAHFGGRNEHEGMPDAMIEFINSVQEEVDAWLKLGRPRRVYNSEDVRNLADQALDAACLLIQQAVGQTDGGLAGVIFSDNAVRDRFVSYIWAEVHAMNEAMPKRMGELIGFDHGGVWITNPYRSSCGRFPATPKDYGFEVWDTGGGCQAWGKNLPDGKYIMITDDNASIPREDVAPKDIHICLYLSHDDDENWTCNTLQEAMDAQAGVSEPGDGSLFS